MIRMKPKLYLSIFVLVLHLLVMVWYYSHSQAWIADNKAFSKLMYFGVGFVCMAHTMIFASGSSSILQREVNKIHGLFVLMLGVLYALNYIVIPFEVTVDRLKILCSCILFIFTMIIYSAWRHGLFKK